VEHGNGHFERRRMVGEQKERTRAYD